MVEVDFGPNERQFKRYDLLELIGQGQEPFDVLRAGQFGTPSDLRRVLIFEKIKGDLTNVFYSMEASNTDFYAHQFKPVMRFIESPIGRLLIADEVGLGKTIEAIYIWKELQARQGARRLLIVCPAMLRDKWRSDLRKRFNITAEFISSKALLEKVEELATRRPPDAFVYITSLEGIRPPANFEDEGLKNTRAKLARLLDQNTATDEYALFDQVIIDEAHYLRNPSTGNNRIGRLLRESSYHLVLLTATPFQIRNENLYQLLRLVDPDEFYNSFLFEEMLRANAHIVRAQRALWRQPPNLDDAATAITAAEGSDYFRNDRVLSRIKAQLSECAHNAETRVEILRLLETRSLFSQYMTRSRKREVLKKRVERAPQVLSVTFSPAEKSIYDHVTQRIRLQSVGRSGVSLFSLIARQRQMASSIVGALESWKDRGLIEELLWDDLGVSPLCLGADDEELADSSEEDTATVAFGFNFDIKELEEQDGKYNALFNFLSGELVKTPKQKFVVFAFYRGTLKYLNRRLTEDGIRTTIMMGGMVEKDDIIQKFATPTGPSVLLSSEVGSEGIDLQFCRFLVNYDLPWNPMKVEQRIGRLDRLGQEAERISIISLAVSNTIEDRILMRLYNRIDLFRESIGDLEEILGEITEKLMVDLLNPTLNDDERDRRAADTELAIQNTQKQQKALEDNAVNLVGFSDYIIQHIEDSRAKGRWLSAGELTALVEDFFARRYPGTRIEPHDKLDSSARITLSDDAKRDLGYFINDIRPATRTRLHHSNRPIICIFDPRHSERVSNDTELIEPSHPLIQWIRSNYERDPRQIHRVSAVKLTTSSATTPPGDYVFCAHRWSFAGIKSDHLLAFSALRIGDKEPLDSATSENLITAAASGGSHFPNANNVIENMDAVCAGALRCEEHLSNAFGIRLSDFEAENSVRCAQQETSAKKFAERRLGELGNRVSRFKSNGSLKAIPMTEGLIRKEEEQLKIKLDRVARRRDVDPTMMSLALGLIRVE
jgi:superfamily II DNA or RNA helicase